MEPRKEEHRAVELLLSVKELILTNILLIICALPFQSQACSMLMQLMSQKVSTKEFQQSQWYTQGARIICLLSYFLNRLLNIRRTSKILLPLYKQR